MKHLQVAWLLSAALLAGCGGSNTSCATHPQGSAERADTKALETWLQ